MPGRKRSGSESFGGLLDLSPLESLVREVVPWKALPGNLAKNRHGALCVSCTEIRSGRVTVFMDGPGANPEPWAFDPNAQAIRSPVREYHVRASAAIPFIFPAVRIDDRYYVDGGLRMNTPLSPALRLGADRVIVIALKHSPAPGAHPPYPEDVITQPAFMLGKVLDALTLDQLEYELHRIELVNAWLDRGAHVYGDEFLGALRQGSTMDPVLVRIAQNELARIEAPEIPTHLAEVAEWIAASDAERGEALRGLVRVYGRIARSRPPRRRRRERRFPRFQSRPAPS